LLIIKIEKTADNKRFYVTVSKNSRIKEKTVFCLLEADVQFCLHCYRERSTWSPFA